MAEHSSRGFTPSVYLSVTDDANRWREGVPRPQMQNQSKVSMLMNAGQGLAIEKNLAKFDVKVLAAETRKQAWIRDLGIGPKTNYVVYIIRVCRIRDGASCVTTQRYSALRNLYNNLKHEGHIRSEDSPDFPGKRLVTEESFLRDRADVNSEFVRHRKEQLGSFLRQFFNKNPELWDSPDVREFFNLDSMDQGKSYAERAHTIAGNGLRNYDPSKPSEWNPYSVAMQAAEQTRNRNADFIGHNANGYNNAGTRSLAEVGVGGAGASGSNEADADRGGGIGAWFRHLGSGGVGGGGGEASANGAKENGENGGPAGWGGSWWGRGGRDEGMRSGGPVELQVQALIEMGFDEGPARQCLRASGYDTNLAAEYCVAGIPPGRAREVAAQASQPAARGPKNVIGNNVMPTGNAGSSVAWQRGGFSGFGTSNGGTSIPSVGSGARSSQFGSGWGARPSPEPEFSSESAREFGASSGLQGAGLDWRNVTRTGAGSTGPGGGTSASGRGTAGGTVDV